MLSILGLECVREDSRCRHTHAVARLLVLSSVELVKRLFVLSSVEAVRAEERRCHTLMSAA